MKNISYCNIKPIQKSASAGITSMTAAVLVLLLGGCASLSPEQCKNANWRQIGFADGANGASGARIDDHAKACAEYGVRANLDEYLRGRSQGLLNYCQAENGFALGRHGTEHNVGDCPENLKLAFLEQYHRGSQIHSLEEEINNYHYRIDSGRKQVRHNDERISEIKAELRKDDLPNDRRTSLLSEFDHLVEKKETILRNNSWLEREIERLENRMLVKLREFGR